MTKVGKPMQVYVTGASGFVGGAVAKAFKGKHKPPIARLQRPSIKV